jgi:release factor glutamine methyltransferase
MSPGTVAESLTLGMTQLSGHSESPRLDAELLLCKVLGLPRSGLVVHGADPLASDRRAAYGALLERRLHGAPIAYLTGTREFWSLELNVTPDVLVPRPDTEVLVEKALELLPLRQARAVLDLGTGSGAIALAIASERPLAHVTGVDISAAALAVAQSNSQALPGLARMTWRLGSWFEPVADECFDLIVSNPPYIAADDPALPALSAEPKLALTPGPTGLEAFDAIIAGAARHLHDDGWLVLEHGSTQAEAVASLLAARGFRDIRSHDDYAGNPRVTRGARPISNFIQHKEKS